MGIVTFPCQTRTLEKFALILLNETVGKFLFVIYYALDLRIVDMIVLVNVSSESIDEGIVEYDD